MNDLGAKETVGFYAKANWQKLPAARKRQAGGALALLAFLWLAGAIHAPSTVDGIARLEGFWRWAAALGMGGFSFLWRLLEHTGAIQETMQRPSLLWMLLAATLPALLIGAAVIFMLPASDAYHMKKQLEQLAEAQGRLAPEEAAAKFAIAQGVPLVNVPDKAGKTAMVGLNFATSKGHALVIAPTQAGKGLHLTETLLHWPGPALIVDPKSEQIERTAYLRSRFGPIYCIPGHSVHLAPYYRRLRDQDEARELHYHMLRPWESQEKIFANKALSLFLAAGDFAGAAHYDALRLLLDMAEGNLVEVLTALRAIPDARRRVDAFTNGTPVNACYEDRFVTSAWGNFTTQLLPYQKHVDTIAPQEPDGILPSEWVRQNATIYVTYNLTDLNAVSGVVAAIIAALLRYQIQRRRKDRLLVAIDELPAVRLHNITDYLPLCAGYGITMLLYAQSVAQLDALYGRGGTQTIMSNCSHQLWYPAGDIETAQAMSELYGVTLKATPARTVSAGARQGRSGAGQTNTHSSSNSWSWREGPAMLPTEMRALPHGRVLAATEGDRRYVFLGQRLNPIPRLAALPPPDGLNLPRPVYGARRYPDWAELATRAQRGQHGHEQQAPAGSSPPEQQDSAAPAAEAPLLTLPEDDPSDTTRLMK